MTLPQSLRQAHSAGANAERDRRSHIRVEMRLTGRFLAGESQDRELVTANVSCDGAFILSPTPPEPGEQVVCYFDQLGRVAAGVVRTEPDGFAVRFQTSPLKRDKLAGRLNWLINRDEPLPPDERTSVRQSSAGHTFITLADGTQLPCRQTDMSLTGAAFEALGALPFVGDRVQTEYLPAEVVRVAGRTFAVRFLRGAEAAGR